MRKNAGLFDTLIGLLIMFIFTACILLVLAGGARVYKGISEELREQYSSRTALSYITAKLRSSDFEGGVSAGEIGGCPALMMYEQIESELYVMYIYWYEGALWELFCGADDEFLPSDGQEIMELVSVSFEFREDSALIKIVCTQENNTAQQYVHIRSGKAERA